jgi:hypothetical protein
MSHHLNLDRHLEIHDEHRRADGHHSTRIIEVNVPLSDIVGFEHELIVRTHAVAPHRRRIMAVSLTVEICNECGLNVGMSCQHGMSYWTHRPGCPRHDPSLPLVWSMYRTYAEALFADPAAPSESCSGCLLVCPVCKADGT